MKAGTVVSMKGEPMKAVVYYRTRPSEPEASEMALQLQQQAVQQFIGTGHHTLVAEFIEREGESGEGWPGAMSEPG